MSLHDCNEALACLQRWMTAQPRSLDPSQPLPSPREVLFDDIENAVCFLRDLDFPNHTLWSFKDGFGYVRSAEDVFTWVCVDQSFERLMAAWRRCWGPDLDPHLGAYYRPTAGGGPGVLFMPAGGGPELWRVWRRVFPDRYTEEPDAPWEPSRVFAVMGSLVNVRTRVVGDDAHMGWEMTPFALYRPDEGLTLIDPDTDEVHAFGMDPSPLPAFLLPFAAGPG
ncbi:MAG: hypothetical protein QGG40_17805, partial [Myxococcota bacterium]|nr:hypothetical protein [Myxococcota bacterium]